MGSCLTRLKKEMRAPPVSNENRQQFGPQRTESHSTKQGNREAVQVGKRDGSTAGMKIYETPEGLYRFETPSGIPGLSYDSAGRPVWREEHAGKASVEYFENRD